MTKEIRVADETLIVRKPKVTLIGSLRFKSQIDEVRDYLESHGVDVAAPPKGLVTNEIPGFKFIEGNEGTSLKDAVEIERQFLEALINSDIGLLVNPGGDNGFTSSWEMGFASTYTPIYSLEMLDWKEPEHPTFQEVREIIPVVPLEVVPFVQKVCRTI